MQEKSKKENLGIKQAKQSIKVQKLFWNFLKSVC